MKATTSCILGFKGTTFTLLAFLSTTSISNGQSTFTVAVKNESGCDIKVGPVADTSCPTTLTTGIGSCHCPDGQTTYCSYTLPAGQNVCYFNISQSPYSVGYVIVQIPCSQYSISSLADVCNTTFGPFVIIEESTCSFIGIYAQ